MTMDLSDQRYTNKYQLPGYRHISIVMSEAEQKLKKIMSGELVPFVSSVRKENDRLQGVFPGDQIVLAGRTGTGKTAKALHDIKDYANPILNPFYHKKVIILYDSWEMLPWRGGVRMLSRDLGLSVQELTSYIDRLKEEQFVRAQMASRELSHMPIYFNNISQDADSWYEAKLNLIGQYTGMQFIILVDHTRLVTSKNEKSEEARLTKLVFNGMRLKQRTDAIVIFLSQMNRNIETNAGGRNDIGKHLPQSSDIFGSDAVYQASDIVVAYHRPGMYGLREFQGIPTGKTTEDSVDTLWIEHVLKNRDGWTGVIRLDHDIANNRFFDPPDATAELFENFNNDN